MSLETFVISRLVDAPREKGVEVLDRAGTRLGAWFGPKGFETIAAKLDFRPGGIYHYGIRGNGVDMWGKWTFKEIDAPAKAGVHQCLFRQGRRPRPASRWRRRGRRR